MINFRAVKNQNGNRYHFKKRVDTEHKVSIKKKPTMPKYVIEREIPGVGKYTPDQLKNISQTSNEVLNKMGSDIKWVNSFVTKDKIYCVYNAKNADLVREHAKLGGFPADSVSEVFAEINPKSAD